MDPWTSSWVEIASTLKILNQNLEIQVRLTSQSVSIGIYFRCVFKHKHDSVSEIRQCHFLYSRCNIWQQAELFCHSCVHFLMVRFAVRQRKLYVVRTVYAWAECEAFTWQHGYLCILKIVQWSKACGHTNIQSFLCRLLKVWKFYWGFSVKQ